MRPAQCAESRAHGISQQPVFRLLARPQADKSVHQREQILDAMVDLVGRQFALFLQLLGHGDIARGAVPTNDPSLLVAKRERHDPKPAIGAVEAIVDVVGLARCQAFLPGGHDAQPVVGMDQLLPGLGLDLFRRDTGELAPAPIEIVMPPLRIRAPDDLRDGFCQDVEARVTLFERRLGLDLIGDVDDDAGELDRIPGLDRSGHGCFHLDSSCRLRRARGASAML